MRGSREGICHSLLKLRFVSEVVTTTDKFEGMHTRHLGSKQTAWYTSHAEAHFKPDLKAKNTAPTRLEERE
jgi:hypothetical protein